MPIDQWENEGGRVNAQFGIGRVGGESNLSTRGKMCAGAARRTLGTNIVLPPEKQKRIFVLLNQQFAETFDLSGQVKQAYWKVRGPQFHNLHEQFGDLAEQVEKYANLIAERATILGATVCTTSEASRLTEYAPVTKGGMQHVSLLAMRFSTLVSTTRSAIDASTELGDAVSADLFTKISHGLVKSLRFLEECLQE
ncbi:MAG: hypothetical protein KDA54_06810 [Phycisphaerales bacterium]|nr:hypothetical protein [Phycisphaerales bacterium]